MCGSGKAKGPKLGARFLSLPWAPMENGDE